MQDGALLNKTGSSEWQMAQIDIVKIVVKAVDKVRNIIGRHCGCCGRRFWI